jgi:hypothetical protein
VEQLLCIMEIMGTPPQHLIEAASRKKVFFDANNQPTVVPNSRGKQYCKPWTAPPGQAAGGALGATAWAASALAGTPRGCKPAVAVGSHVTFCGPAQHTHHGASETQIKTQSNRRLPD